MNRREYQTILLAALLHDLGMLFGTEAPAPVKEAETDPVRFVPVSRRGTTFSNGCRVMTLGMSTSREILGGERFLAGHSQVQTRVRATAPSRFDRFSVPNLRDKD